MLEQNILGINFKNPVGLAAGFDKNGELTNILPSVGFGFIEIGSITGEECAGNPKPRLWRVPSKKSLLVYYGLKNDGSEAISKRLENKKFSIPIGVSIAKTNCQKTVELQAGIDDYLKAYKNFINIGSYNTINISCPNAFGGEPFTDGKKLDLLLTEIDKIPSQKPNFLKLSPDLSDQELDDIITISQRHNIQGFICTNLTKNIDRKTIDKNLPDHGGFSGKIVEKQANHTIEYIYKKTEGKYIIIGCGGIFSAEDAYNKIKSGASLIQMITGMIYQGPQAIGQINRGLTQLLQQDGYQNIAEAVGNKKY